MKMITIVMKNFLLILSIFLFLACGNNPEKNNTLQSEEENKALLVEVETIRPEHFEHHFTANGSVEAVRSAFISPEMNGQIKRIHVKEGQRVSKGQLLVSLNGAVLTNGIKEVETALELARTLYKKQKELWDQKIGSEVQYLQAKSNMVSLEDKLKTLQSQRDMTKIFAPYSGIIDNITLKEGELAAPGMQLIQLVNLSEVYINADISESYLPYISKGDSITVEFPTYPDTKIRTTVYRVGNVINTQNRTFPVQLKLRNKDEKLKPNLMAVVNLKDFETDNALLVPSIVIKKDINGDYVYVVSESNGETIAEKRYVTPGKTAEDKTMVDKGLNAGDRIITQGYNLVKNGMQIKIK